MRPSTVLHANGRVMHANDRVIHANDRAMSANVRVTGTTNESGHVNVRAIFRASGCEICLAKTDTAHHHANESG